MKNSITVLKFSIWTACTGFLLLSCGSTPEIKTPAKHIVEIKAMKFQPAELIVNKGDTVMWINRDMVAHDVAEEPNKAWTSQVLPTGASWSLVVAESVEYYCSIHMVMKGRIIMQQ